MPAKDPEKKENWKREVLSEELHVVPQLLAGLRQAAATDRPHARSS